MKKQSQKKRLQAIETIASSCYASLTKARHLLTDNHVSLASLAARSIWPVVIWCIHQRVTMPTNGKPRQRSTTTLIKGMTTTRSIDLELCERLKQADVLAVMGPESASDALTLIDTALNGLEATESEGTRRRRQRADGESRRLLSPRRWARAAVVLLSIGGAS